MSVEDLFRNVLAEAESEIGAEDVEKINENIDEVIRVVTQVCDLIKEGPELSDVSKIGQAVAPAMKWASEFKEYEGEQKRQFVIDLVWLIYRTIDTLPDGKGNNVNIPIVFGSLERRAERAFVHFAVGVAVDALFDRMRKQGEV